jgi:hypothetical protein
MPAFFSGYYNTTRVLNNPTAQNPATVTQFGTINIGATAAAGTPGISGTSGTAGAFAWTLTNNGTIQSTPSAGVGVNLQFGGSVTNTTFVGTAAYPPALIAATGVAVQITGGAGTVSNSATISQTGAGGGAPLTAGVFLGSGGRVSNTGTISSQATNGSGINLGNGSVTVVNGVSGSNVGLISGFNDGILGNLGASASTITNYGRIQSTNAIGVQLISAGTVSNFGTITTAQTSSAGAAVQLSGGSSLTNNTGGLIQGGATGLSVNGTLLASVANFGTVRAVGTNTFASGIAANPSGSTVTNAGTVFVGAFGNNATGIRLNNGGTAINSGVVNAAYGQNEIGVSSFSSVAGAVINSGTIMAAGTTSGVGININRGSINNSGLISGSSRGLFVTYGFATVNNTGTITSGANGAGTVNGSGISFGSSAGGSINNAGTISAASANNGSAIGVFGTSGGTIVNAAGGLITAYHIGIGVFPSTATSSPLIVTNYGTIRTTQIGPPSVTGFNGFAIQAGSTAGPTTITNFGLVSGSQTAGGGGVLLASGGTVVNKAGATIDGAGGNAITTPLPTNPGLPITVVNSGTLKSFSTTNSLSYLGHGGSVTNNAGGLLSANGDANGVSSPVGGIVTNSGTILSALATGVTLRGSPGTVTNFGTIAHTGIGTRGEAVYLGAGGSVSNYGLISGSRPGAPLPVGYPGVIDAQNQPVTVRNLGIVTNPNYSNGINLGSGGTLINGSPSATSATISAPHTGVYIGGRGGTPIAGAVGLITNYGTIASTGTHNGVSIVSGGSIANRGLISAGANGVSFRYQTGTVTNFGTIMHTGAGTSGEAVYLGGGGVVVNYGLMTGARPGAPVPVGYPGVVQANNQPVFVANLGTVTNPGNGNGVNLLLGGTLVNGSPSATGATISGAHHAIYMGGKLNVPYPNAPGFITNYGVIANSSSTGSAISIASGGSIGNRGLISSARTGIAFNNTAGTVDNFGNIVSTASTSFTAGSGVYLQNGGLITNEAGASITAQRAAVSLGGTSTTTASVLVTNSGTLTGDVGIKIGLGDTGNNTIVNFGTISGTSGLPSISATIRPRSCSSLVRRWAGGSPISTPATASIFRPSARFH